MNKIRKQQLEERGWRVGSTADFLNLSREESDYIELKLALGKNIKIKRLSRKITQVELAKSMGSSQSRIVKIENGDSSVSLDLQVKTLLILGASRKDLAKIISMKDSSTLAH